jgi:hypothetical protein
MRLSLLKPVQLEDSHMTPEQQLEILKTTLNQIASLGDGDVQTLLKTNQWAADALKAISPKRWRVTYVFETNPDIDVTKEWCKFNIDDDADLFSIETMD